MANKKFLKQRRIGKDRGKSEDYFALPLLTGRTGYATGN